MRVHEYEIKQLTRTLRMSAADGAFTVTLPSNTDMRTFPKNRGADFQVRLACPLSLEGQTLNEGNDWEVALTSLQYTNQFFDVPQPITMRVVLEYTQIGVLNTNSTPKPYNTHIFANKLTRAQLVTFMATDKSYGSNGVLDKTDQVVLLRHTGQDTQIPDGNNIAFGKFYIPAAQYGNGLAVHRQFVTKFNELFAGARYNVKLTSHMVKASGTMKMVMEKPVAVNIHVYANAKMAASALGLKQGQEVSGSNMEETENLWQLKYDDCDLPPRVEAVQSLYVYCDIVKHQHVGNVLTPLLEVVPVRGRPGERMHYAVNVLSYLPLTRTFIDHLHVRILDETGNEVPFPDELENVVVRLRFRRKKARSDMLF